MLGCSFNTVRLTNMVHCLAPADRVITRLRCTYLRSVEGAGEPDSIPFSITVQMHTKVISKIPFSRSIAIWNAKQSQLSIKMETTDEFKAKI